MATINKHKTSASGSEASLGRPLCSPEKTLPMKDTGRSVVMIDDSDDLRDAMEAILAQAGYRVTATGDPRQALDLVREHQPDFVLCDIAMPGMDGHEVVRALQADPVTARVPVVFLTARHEFTERVRAFRFGVVCYLTKPIAPEVLIEKIARILGILDQRRGAVEASSGDLAQELVVELQSGRRTGLLTMAGDGAQSRIVLRSGAVVDKTGEVASPVQAHFEEIDPLREQIVTSNPTSSPSEGPPSAFDDILPGLREALIADPDPQFRAFLRSLLEARGFQVQDASRGEEALRMALERPPQITVVDARMEGLDGFELCRRLRAHRATQNLPVLFLSGCQALSMAPGVEPATLAPLAQEILHRIQLLMRRYALAASASEGGSMEGAVEVLGPAGLLLVCQRAELSGTLEARRPAETLRMRFEKGALVDAASNEEQGRAAVFQFVAWERGRFTFQQGATSAGETIKERTDLLILEACRKFDEQAALKRDSNPAPSAR